MIVALIALAAFVVLLSVQVCCAQKKIRFLELWLSIVDDNADLSRSLNKLVRDDFEKRLKKLESEGEENVVTDSM
jgi:hypothetical protein